VVHAEVLKAKRFMGERLPAPPVVPAGAALAPAAPAAPANPAAPRGPVQVPHPLHHLRPEVA